MSIAHSASPRSITAEEFAQVVDHTLLKSDATHAEVRTFVDDALSLGVARVCISPSQLPLRGHDLELVTVVGFPSGAHTAQMKAAETREAIARGAHEIDMVINLALVRAREWSALAAEIRAVREACPGHVLKVIIESAALSDDEIVQVCKTAQSAGATFVKTSTGFHPAGGASVHAVKLMHLAVGRSLGIKASGGVRAAAHVQELWAAGATRFGVSATAAILAEMRSEIDDAHDADDRLLSQSTPSTG